MKVLDSGHVYALDHLDATDLNRTILTFVKREGTIYPGNVGHHPGTNMQEVLRALIDRFIYLDHQIPNWRNKLCVKLLRKVIYLLECRAAERHSRKFSYYINAPHEWAGIETLPVCPKCLHIGCQGTCHA